MMAFDISWTTIEFVAKTAVIGIVVILTARLTSCSTCLVRQQ